MNVKLHITIDGEEFPVYPTPAHITYMCMATDFTWNARLEGKEAKRAIQAYIFWVNYMHPDDELEGLHKSIKLGTEFEVRAQ
jgi:hypothetical protein